MSILGLLFGQSKASIGGIVIDASVGEEHLTTADVTENPVEDGAKITDHVQLKPAQLTMEGVISDAPLGYAVIGNIQNFKQSVVSLFSQTYRSIDYYNQLLALQTARKPFTVVTGLKRYTNMILAELSVPRSADKGGAIHFRAVLKEIRIVESKTTGVSNLKDDVSNLGGKTNDLGQQVTDTVPVSSPLSATPSSITDASKPSLLFKIFK